MNKIDTERDRHNEDSMVTLTTYFRTIDMTSSSFYDFDQFHHDEIVVCSL